MNSRHTILDGGTVLWGDDLHPIRGARLMTTESSIDRLLQPGEDPPDDARVIDCVGCTVLPGLIDTHCHLTLPGDGRDVDQFLAIANDDELVRLGLDHAYQALRGGVTTLRDLGARGSTGFDLVEQLGRETLPTPRVLTSGPVLTPPDGHGRTFGLPVRASKIASAVARLREQGAAVIKLMASGGSTVGTQAWTATLSEEEIRMAVREAHRLGVPVAAHISCPDAAVRCLQAGVDDFEHLNLWTDASYTNQVSLDLLQAIRARDIFVGPTLQTPYRILHEKASAEDSRASIRKKLYRDVLSNFEVFAHEQLRLIAGSDAGFLVTRFDELWLGLQIMVEHGLSEREAIRSATVEAAAALQLSSTTGCLKPGLAADLLIVSGSPLTSITALSAVRAVLVGGCIVQRPSCEEPMTSA